MVRDCEDVLWIILDLQGTESILESSGSVQIHYKICGLWVKEKGLFLIRTEIDSVW